MNVVHMAQPQDRGVDYQGPHITSTLDITNTQDLEDSQSTASHSSEEGKLHHILRGPLYTQVSKVLSACMIKMAKLTVILFLLFLFLLRLWLLVLLVLRMLLLLYLLFLSPFLLRSPKTTLTAQGKLLWSAGLFQVSGSYSFQALSVNPFGDLTLEHFGAAKGYI